MAFQDLLIQILPSFVVGFGGAWLATQKALTAHAEKIATNERAIRTLDARMTEAHNESTAQTIAVVERLARVETKIDIWLQRANEQWTK